jgi:hypothetical protein
MFWRRPALLSSEQSLAVAGSILEKRGFLGLLQCVAWLSVLGFGNNQAGWVVRACGGQRITNWEVLGNFHGFGFGG